MAIENEYKIVLHTDFSEAALSSWTRMVIKQSYIDDCRPYITRDEQGAPVFGFYFEKDGQEAHIQTSDIRESDYQALATLETTEDQGRLFISGFPIRIRQKNDTQLYTFKAQVNGDLIEVEDKFKDSSDFNALLAISREPISKVRFEKQIGEDLWCVDFLKTRDAIESVYFVMAEVERPEGVGAPGDLPHEISKSVLFRADQGDEAVTNRNLSNIVKARAFADMLEGLHP